MNEKEKIKEWLDTYIEKNEKLIEMSNMQGIEIIGNDTRTILLLTGYDYLCAVLGLEVKIYERDGVIYKDAEYSGYRISTNKLIEQYAPEEAATSN